MRILDSIREPGSAITHFIGLLMAVAASIPLLVKAANENKLELLCMVIFMLSMILLYAASTTFHTFDINPEVNRILQKIDHCAISVLIAGTYTPVCVLVLRQPTGRNLCILVWSIAIAGILIKVFWITCPKWFSSVLYIAMGWACVTAFPALLRDLHAEESSGICSAGRRTTSGETTGSCSAVPALGTAETAVQRSPVLPG